MRLGFLGGATPHVEHVDLPVTKRQLEIFGNVGGRRGPPRAGFYLSPPPCLVMRDGGWWEYEFCFDRWIRQYHQENNVIKSEYFLGFGPRAGITAGDEDDYDPIKDALKGRTVASDENDELLAKHQKIPLTPPPFSPLVSGNPLSRPLLYDDGVHSVARKLAEHGQPLRPPPPEPTGGSYSCSRDLDLRWASLRASAAAKSSQSEKTRSAPPPPSEHVAIQYGGGSRCASTGNAAREAQVVFVCDRAWSTHLTAPGVGGGQGNIQPYEIDVAFNLTEVQTCRYVVFVFGRTICDTISWAKFEGDHSTQLDERGDTTPPPAASAPAAPSAVPADEGVTPSGPGTAAAPVAAPRPGPLDERITAPPTAGRTRGASAVIQTLQTTVGKNGQLSVPSSSSGNEPGANPASGASLDPSDDVAVGEPPDAAQAPKGGSALNEDETLVFTFI